MRTELREQTIRSPSPPGRARRSTLPLPGGSWIAAIFGFWTLIALFLVSQTYLFRMARGDPFSWPNTFAAAFADMYLWALLTVVVFALVQLLPLERGRWGRVLLAHLAIALVLVPMRLVTDYYVCQWLPHIENRPLAVVFFSRSPHVLIWYLLLVGIAYGIQFFQRYRERELTASQLETRLARAQLQMLKMQLHPHFLFNTLHAISTLVHRSPDAAERMIASLSEMLRTSLAHGKAQEVTLQEELEFLAPYLEIEQTRFGERLQVEMEVEPQALQARIPHLLLQPLVENAIRHGIAPRKGSGRVQISAVRANGHLLVRVRDNGLGIPEGPRSARSGGVGLSNTRSRLEQLYGGEHRFMVENAPEGGTVVDITLPFHSPTNGSHA